MDSEIDVVSGDEMDDSVGNNLSIEQSENNVGNPKRKYGKRWYKHDDSLLMYLFGKYGENWDLIWPYFPDRNNQHVINRWMRLHTEEIRKSEWSPEEDTKLEQLVCIHGKQWTRVSEEMPGRSGTKCRQRWIHHIKKKPLPVVESPPTVFATDTSQNINTNSNDDAPHPTCLTPLSFKNELVALGTKTIEQREAARSPGFIEDLDEVLESETNNREKLDEMSGTTTQTDRYKQKRPCTSLGNLWSDNKIKKVEPMNKKKNTSSNELDLHDEKNDESTKENCSNVRPRTD